MDKLRKNKSKLLLSKSLLELLEVKAFNSIKVNEICDHALVHKTTFYNHFDDKYDLLNYIVKQIHNDIKNKAEKRKGIIEYYISIARLYIIEIKKNASLFSSIASARNNEISFYMFYDLYVHDVSENLAKLSVQIPSKYIAIFYVNAVFAVVNEWFIGGMQESEDTIISYIEALIKEEKQL